MRHNLRFRSIVKSFIVTLNYERRLTNFTITKIPSQRSTKQTKLVLENWTNRVLKRGG